MLTRTVVDSSGRPVDGAYVIGLDSLTVAQTDASGQFMMPCQPSVNGISGSRAEPLVAGAWLLPVQPTGQGSYAYGRNTTSYPPPPTSPGLGYGFSGGAPTPPTPPPEGASTSSSSTPSGPPRTRFRHLAD